MPSKGNLLWGGKKRESKKKDESSGKGGEVRDGDEKGQTNTESW